MIQQIIIVGGGTAGWLTAGIIAAEYQSNSSLNIEITLVESPEVKTIGVGEGTWPSMCNTLRKIGISETDFIRECCASFKQGSKFVGWKNGRTDDVYYHPFSLPQTYAETNPVAVWQTQSQFSDITFADTVCMQSHFCEAGRAPKQITMPEYAGAANYGYHLDAGKFATLLQKHCVEKLGVKHVTDHVVNVVSANNGDIEALETKHSGALKGDLFIDCSGFTCLLLGEHYKISFIDKKAISINDSAIVTQVSYTDDSNAIASPTIATAQSAGWTWDLGLSSRRGVGYVYSSAHITVEQAESELRAYVSKSVGQERAEAITSRKISIRAGHRKQFWYKNCVAVGMSAGFIEPLEASALALVELSANMIRDELIMTRETMEIVSHRFNSVFLYRWERIIEFLKLHYALTQRVDTEYWRDASEMDTVPDRLRELLAVWRYRPPSSYDLLHTEEIFPCASYQYVLYGMGFKPPLNEIAKRSNRINNNLINIKEHVDKARKYSAALPSNRELIDLIYKHGLQKI